MTAASPIASAVILRAIEDAADAGRPCPTNDDLAGLASCSCSHVCNVITSLKKSGIIRTHMEGRYRVITVVRSGNSTSLPPRVSPRNANHYRLPRDHKPGPAVESYRAPVDDREEIARRADAVKQEREERRRALLAAEARPFSDRGVPTGIIHNPEKLRRDRA